MNFGDKHRYDGSAAEPPTDQEMDAARDLKSPFVIWRYRPEREIHRVWWMEPLTPGDLVMIPVGSPPNALVQARGIATFSNSRESVVNTRFQGVRMKLLEEARVQVPLQTDYLGWDLFEVTAVDVAQLNLAGLDHEVAGQDMAALDGSQSYLGSGWSQIDWSNGARAEPFRWGYKGAQLQMPASGGQSDSGPGAQWTARSTARSDTCVGSYGARDHFVGAGRAEKSRTHGAGGGDGCAPITGRDSGGCGHDLFSPVWCERGALVGCPHAYAWRFDVRSTNRDRKEADITGTVLVTVLAFFVRLTPETFRGFVSQSI